MKIFDFLQDLCLGVIVLSVAALAVLFVICFAKIVFQ